jgi:hypothetical protein
MEALKWHMRAGYGAPQSTLAVNPSMGRCRAEGVCGEHARRVMCRIQPHVKEQGGLPIFRPPMWCAYLDLAASFHACTHAGSLSLAHVFTMPSSELRWGDRSMRARSIEHYQVQIKNRYSLEYMPFDSPQAFTALIPENVVLFLTPFTSHNPLRAFMVTFWTSKTLTITVASQIRLWSFNWKRRNAARLCPPKNGSQNVRKTYENYVKTRF